MDAFEVPYCGKRWLMLVLFVFLCATMVLVAIAATKDPSASFAGRIFLWVLFAFVAFPTYVCGASFVVTLFVKHTLKLTATEISAPHSMFAVHSTHVQLSTVTSVSLGTLRNRRRYLNIYYRGGRLGIAEEFMPSQESFNKVLVAFSNTPGANNSFKADGFAAA